MDTCAMWMRFPHELCRTLTIHLINAISGGSYCLLMANLATTRLSDGHTAFAKAPIAALTKHVTICRQYWNL